MKRDRAYFHDRAVESMDAGFGLGADEAYAILRRNAEAKRIYDVALEAMADLEMELARLRGIGIDD